MIISLRDAALVLSRNLSPLPILKNLGEMWWTWFLWEKVLGAWRKIWNKPPNETNLGI